MGQLIKLSPKRGTVSVLKRGRRDSFPNYYCPPIMLLASDSQRSQTTIFQNHKNTSWGWSSSSNTARIQQLNQTLRMSNKERFFLQALQNNDTAIILPDSMIMSVLLRVSVEIRASVTHPWQQRTSGAASGTRTPRKPPFWLNFLFRKTDAPTLQPEGGERKWEQKDEVA